LSQKKRAFQREKGSNTHISAKQRDEPTYARVGTIQDVRTGALCFCTHQREGQHLRGKMCVLSILPHLRLRASVRAYSAAVLRICMRTCAMARACERAFLRLFAAAAAFAFALAQVHASLFECARARNDLGKAHAIADAIVRQTPQKHLNIHGTA